MRAHVFACGDCRAAGERFVGYLESFSPEIVAKRVEMERKYGQPLDTLPPVAFREAGIDPSKSGRLVAKPDAKPQWVPAEEPAADEITGGPTARCGGKKPAVECEPGM